MKIPKYVQEIKKEDTMQYKMRVIITDPQTEKGMNSDILFNLNCYFHYTGDNDYGKKTYLRITADNREMENCYDLRYDMNYHPDRKEEFLEYWARNYWSGENGAWAIKSLEIEKV